jgi:hypothetical protein
MMMSDAIQRLRERLETGWKPKADEIDRAVPQVDALNWQWNFEESIKIVPLGITYQTIDGQPRKTGPVIYIDEHMTYALTREGLHWLYGSEESENDPLGYDTRDPDHMRKMARDALDGRHEDAVEAEIAAVERSLGLTPKKKSRWRRIRRWLSNRYWRLHFWLSDR